MRIFLYTISILFLFLNLSHSQDIIIDSLLNQISVDSLRLYVRQLSGDTSCVIGGVGYTILSRHKLQPGNDKSAEYIYEKFQSFGLQTTYEKFSSTGSNVIGTKIGTHFPTKYYILCAHFDNMPPGTIAPGADDNASGTAAVIEIARVFSKYDFKYSIKFIGFDEEEQGLIGSDYYAKQAKLRGDSIMGVINLDMIAYDGNNDGKMNVHTKNVSNSHILGVEFVHNVAAFDLQLDPAIIPSQPISDHDSFLKRDYGAILIIENQSDFNPNYHTINDKSIFLTYPYFDRMVKAVSITLAKFAFSNNPDVQLASVSPFSPPYLVKIGRAHV